MTPVFLDQYDSAHAVQKLGVGVGFHSKQLQKTSASELAVAIQKVTTDPGISKRALEVGEQLKTENGVQVMVKNIQEFWNEKVTTRSFQDELETIRRETRDWQKKYAKEVFVSRIVYSCVAVAMVAACYGNVLGLSR